MKNNGNKLRVSCIRLEGSGFTVDALLLSKSMLHFTIVDFT